MTKKSRKKKKEAREQKLRKPSVQQQQNWADWTPHRHKNETTRSHTFDQINRTPPPEFAEKVLYCLLPRDGSEGVIGDLAEHFQRVQPKLGTKGARIWYYKEAGILLLQQFSSVVKLAFYAWAGEFFRWLFK